MSPPQEKPRLIVGLDLGQVQDPSALTVVEKRLLRHVTTGRVESFYDVRYLRRWPLGTPYPQIVRDVTEFLGRPIFDFPLFAVDQTGVGKPIVDLFREVEPPLPALLRPMGITAGSGYSMGADGVWRVAKSDLVGVLQVLFQNRRLKIANVPNRDVLAQELSTFKVKITAAKNEVFEAWRDRDHDDLVLAVGIACWLGEHDGSGAIGQWIGPARSDQQHWSQRTSRAEQAGLFGMRPRDDRRRRR